eukprot:s764_g11.t1
MLHGAVANVFTLHDYVVSWRHQGNQIAVMHAMMVLLKVCACVDFAKHVTFADVFDTWDHQRLKNSNAIFNQGLAGFQLHHVGFPFELQPLHHQNIHDCVTSFGKGLLPEDKWWDIHGLHDIGAPFPVSPFTNMHIAATLEDVTQNTEAQREPVSSSAPTITQPFCVTLPACLKLDQGDLSFWVASMVTPSDLQMLWFGGFEVQQTAESIILTKTAAQTPLAIDHQLFPVLVDGRLTVYEADAHDFHKFCHDFLSEESWFDQFGEIKAGMHFSPDICLTTKMQKHEALPCDTTMLFAAYQNCTMCYHYQDRQDAWVCELTGSDDARKLLAKVFAIAIAKETLVNLGRTVSIEHHEHSTLVAFRPANWGTPVPPHVMPKLLAVAITRSVMDTFHTEKGLPVSFKWSSRILWQGTIDPQVTAEVVKALMMYTLAPVTKLREVRLVSKGQQFASGPFQCFVQEADIPPTKFFLAFELCGGTAGTSTKGQLKQQVRNSFAAWMLESGIELQWVQQHIEQAIDDIGVKKLVPIVQQPASAKRDSQFKQALADAKIQMPSPPATQVSVHAIRTKQKKRQVVMPEPADYQVDCTYLLKQNGDEVTQLQDFRANMNGVFLTNAAGALPWLRDGQQLSPDELGLLVIGPLPHETTLPTTQIALPCFNADAQQVLLQVTMVQFGAKAVEVKPWDQTIVSAATSKVCSLTLWQQDWTKEEWTSALHHTSQFLKEIFATDGLQQAIGSTWGRSLRKGKQPATHRDATSLQIHAAIHDAHYMAFLKASGYNRVWAAPKAENGRLVGDFRILWLPAPYDLQKASTITAKLTGVAGLVRGKSSIGIRMTNASFDTAWAVVYPQTQPADVSNKWTFKLEPLPYGCNAEMLTEWGEHVKWKLRPLKAVVPKAWLICTGDEPPAGPLSFNGHPVLPRKMQPRTATKEQTILAGPRARYSADAAQASSSQAIANTTDPWWTYMQRRGLTPAPQPAPNVTGPTEQRLAQQDAKVAALETKLQAIETLQGTQTGMITQIQHDLQNTEQKLAQSLTHAMDEVKAELTYSFGDALNKQTKSFESSFADLKNALLQPKRKSPGAGDEDMQD